MKNALVVFVLFLFAAFLANAQKQDSSFYSSFANCAQSDQNGRLYVGGRDTIMLGKFNPSGNIIDSAGKITNLKTNDAITAASKDGKGGWFIAGYFTKVNNIPRTYIAHINSDGSLDGWNIRIGGWNFVQIYSLCLDGSKLYIGGSFDSINGQIRRDIAVVDVTNGKLLNWDPRLPFENGEAVHSIKVVDSEVFVGGQIDSVNGNYTNNFFAVDTVTGKNTYYKLAKKQISAPIGNFFFKNGKIFLNEKAIYGIQVLDSSTGDTITWGPLEIRKYFNGKAFFEDSVVYCGILKPGDTSATIVAVNLITGNYCVQQPLIKANSLFNIYNKVGKIFYLGGGFTRVNGLNRKGVCLVDMTGHVLSFDPEISLGYLKPIAGFSWDDWIKNGFSSLLVDNNKVLVCGKFAYTNTLIRRGIYAIDEGSGLPTKWNPVIPGAQNIWQLAHNDTLVFASVQTKKDVRLVAIDKRKDSFYVIDSGMLNNRGVITKMVVKNDKLYLIGIFNSLQNQKRPGVGCFNIRTGKVTSWYPRFLVQNPAGVFDIFITGNKVLLVGGNQGEHFVVADTFTGKKDTTWKFNQNDLPEGYNRTGGLDQIGNKIYMYGRFTQFDSTLTQDQFVEFDTITKTLTNLKGVLPILMPINTVICHNATFYVHAIDVYKPSGYSIGGFIRHSLAAVNGITGTVSSWNFQPGTSYLLDVSSKNVYCQVQSFSYLTTIAISADQSNITDIHPPVWESNNLKVYPNPFENTAIVELPSNFVGNYSFALYDVSGKMVDFKSNLNEPKLEIRKNNLNAGIYFLRLQENNGKEIGSIKLIIK